jgi:hypothetical protein
MYTRAEGRQGKTESISLANKQMQKKDPKQMQKESSRTNDKTGLQRDRLRREEERSVFEKRG